MTCTSYSRAELRISGCRLQRCLAAGVRLQSALSALDDETVLVPQHSQPRDMPRLTGMTAVAQQRVRLQVPSLCCFQLDAVSGSVSCALALQLHC